MTESVYERDLESLIAGRLGLLEKGLQLVGRQYSTPVGRIDLLCKDRRGGLVVVELKSFGARTNEIIDQIARYMGYVKIHIARPEQIVRGIIVVGQVQDSLSYAVLTIPNLEIRTFDVRISPVPSFAASSLRHELHRND
jgi:RecB family endonuclease NucS